MSMKISNAETSSSMTHHGQIKFPMSGNEASKIFANYFVEFERKEILDVQKVYYFNV